ncbi:type II toxin-antitoxin system VapC family toxin [Brachybacterium sp. DNPG3]
MIVYLDTSAVLKLIIEEPESAAMREAFAAWQADGADLVSSFLLFTELHRAAARRGLGGADGTGGSAVIDMVLAGIGLIDVDRSHLVAAARESGGLRSADAIHLAVARSVEADLLVVHDRELFAAARSAGVAPIAPGRPTAGGERPARR